MSYEQFAAVLLKTETDSRDSHGGQARIKAARFPARKTLEEFDSAFQSSVRRDGVLHLGRLDFLAGKEDVGRHGADVGDVARAELGVSCSGRRHGQDALWNSSPVASWASARLAPAVTDLTERLIDPVDWVTGVLDLELSVRRRPRVTCARTR